MPPFSAGSWFHSLHATSHALHPMQTVVSVKNPMGSGRSCLLHVADERLAFVDRHIGVTHPGGEIADHISGGEPHPAPVPGHADMVDEFAADAHFFFQAEDGIRDLTVTGVQTCALPICFHDYEMGTARTKTICRRFFCSWAVIDRGLAIRKESEK